MDAETELKSIDKGKEIVTGEKETIDNYTIRTPTSNKLWEEAREAFMQHRETRCVKLKLAEKK